MTVTPARLQLSYRANLFPTKAFWRLRKSGVAIVVSEGMYVMTTVLECSETRVVDSCRDVVLGHDCCASSVFDEFPADDLSREVYCILGLPIDAIDLPSVLRRINFASANSSPLFVSTPNLNYLINSHANSEFRQSLLLSDLCPTDGVPVVWLGRLLGAPIKGRVAGSDILAATKTIGASEHPLRLFLFGGAEGVAAAASRALNAERNGVVCVGSFYPGFGSVEELSNDEIIDTINSSGADFLVVSLGANKGQAWLTRNYDRLQIPIRAHLGATLNFEAGTVKRAPIFMRKLCLEWLWRVKEEPYLWRRYWHDGVILLRLLNSHVLPLIINRFMRRKVYLKPLVVDAAVHDELTVNLKICGAATSNYIDRIEAAFRAALTTRKRIVIDFSATSAVDARFLGLLLMFRKRADRDNTKVTLRGLSSGLKRLFRLNGAEFLLEADNSTEGDAILGFPKTSAA